MEIRNYRLKFNGFKMSRNTDLKVLTITKLKRQLDCASAVQVGPHPPRHVSYMQE